jgi:histone deacetylase complex regulatory component SIN3
MPRSLPHPLPLPIQAAPSAQNQASETAATQPNLMPVSISNVSASVAPLPMTSVQHVSGLPPVRNVHDNQGPALNPTSVPVSQAFSPLVQRQVLPTSSPPPPQTAQPTSSSPSNHRRQLKVEDALAYLEQVKMQFEGQPTVYNQFLDIMKEFKAQTIDTAEVIKRVSELFQGHKDLILGFNTFLPPGYHIEVRENQETGILSTGFSSPSGFSELPQHSRVATSREDAHPTAQSLIKEDAASSTEAASAVPGPAATTATAMSLAPGCPPMHAVDIAVGTGATSSGFGVGTAPTAATSSCAPSRIQATSLGSKKRPGSSPRRKESKQKHPQHVPVNNAETSGTNAVSTPLKESPTPYQHTTASTEPPIINVVAGVNTPVDGLVGPLPRDAADFERALMFINRLKEQLRPHEYSRFMALMDGYRTVPVGYNAMLSVLVETVGGDHIDLLKEFVDLLPALGQVPNITGGAVKRGAAVSRLIASTRRSGDMVSKGQRNGPGGSGVRRSAAGEKVMLFFDEAKALLGSSAAKTYPEFMKCLSLYSNEIISKDELVSIAVDLFRDFPSVNDLFTQHLEAVSAGDLHQDGNNSSASSATVARATSIQSPPEHRAALYRSKPMSEIAAESEQKCTASYKKMPSDYPPLICSGRTALEKKTLNDTWVSVTSGSEDYSFKFMRKNQFEDNLFRCEDDRYELDLVIETNASTILKLEPIAVTIAKLPSADKQRHFLADGALSAVNFNAIQRIYGEVGPEIVAQVKMNPAISVPIVLRRLRDRDEAWRRARVEMNVIWREVGEKNYHRSLDHRSSYFKQVDKKELSSKSLLADILTPGLSYQARQNEMTRARGYAIPSGGGRPNDRSPAADAVAILALMDPADDLVPSLELPYEEDGIHCIVYSLVMKAVSAGSPQSRDDTGDMPVVALRNYKRFVKAFFCVDVDTEATDGDKNVDKTPVVFYGDESIYLMFRLHHLVYERLTAAKQMAQEKAADQAFRNECNERGRQRVASNPNMRELDVPPSQLTRELVIGGPETPIWQVNSGFTDAEVLFGEYIKTLREFLDRAIDMPKYEDNSRFLLGQDSYCLSTMDKTLAKLVKQLLLVFGDESSSTGLVSLFYKSRENIAVATNPSSAQGVEDIYSIAASSALRKLRGSGANMFRLQHVHRESSPDQLVIHVIGLTCGDEDDEKRAEEAEAINRFLGFRSGIHDGSDVDDGIFRGKPASLGSEDDDDIGQAARRSRSGSGDTNSDDGSGSPGGNGERADPMDMDSKTGGSTSPERTITVDRCRHTESFVTEDMRPNKKLRSTAGGLLGVAAAGVVAKPPFVRFAGPASRVLSGKILIRNEIEFRVSASGHLSFVDGKVDSLVNLSRKRKWQPAELSAAGSLTAERAQANEQSTSVGKFRSFLSRALSSGSNVAIDGTLRNVSGHAALAAIRTPFADDADQILMTEGGDQTFPAITSKSQPAAKQLSVFTRGGLGVEDCAEAAADVAASEPSVAGTSTFVNSDGGPRNEANAPLAPLPR